MRGSLRTLFIQLTVSGELEVEATIGEEYEDSNLEYEYKYIRDEIEMVPIFKHRRRVRNKTKYFYPEISATVGITLEDETISFDEIFDIEFL